MIHSHVPDELLLDYASGAITGGTAVLIAAHLTLCPLCRRKVTEMEAIAGAMMASATPRSGASVDGAWTVPLRDLVRGTQPPKPDLARFDPVLPKPLYDAVGLPFEAIPWNPLLSGVQEYVLFHDGDEDEARLLVIAPGRAMPRHTHEGQELTLVLSGAFSDATGYYGPGDVAVADETVDHSPVAEDGSVCICFAVNEGPLHLTGPVGRILSFFT